MKTTSIYIILLLLAVASCTKDVGIATPPEPSQRYKALTQNYWRLDHYWKDTSQIAKDNPALVPLSTSYDNTLYVDSCAYYTGRQFSTDGYVYIAKGKHCGCNTNPPCLSSYLGPGFPVTETPHWYLKVNESKIHYGNDQNGYFILNLDNATFSYYRYQPYNFTKTLIEVYVFKSYTDW